MKRFIINFLLLLLLIVSLTSVKAQQVPKNYVVLEIGTATSCQSCPLAAIAADSLLNSGYKVAVIEYHGFSNDAFYNSSSDNRMNYYNIVGVPNALFNGGNSTTGATNNGLYNTYLSKYNQAMSVMSDFTLSMSYTHTANNYSVSIQTNEVGNYSGQNLAVHLVWVETDIAYSWQNQSKLTSVNRGMYPSQNGSSYTGGSQTFTINFSANSSWNTDKSELIAFIQDVSTKEILQATKVYLKQSVGQNNIGINSIKKIDDLCDNSFTPEITIQNKGAQDVSTFIFNYSINNGANTGTYTWTGQAIKSNEKRLIKFSNITFNIQNSNALSINVQSVNNASDDDNSDNSASINFNQITKIANHSNIKVKVLTDNNGIETSWKLVDLNTNTIIANGNNLGSNTLYETNVTVNPNSCYRFYFYDTGGDGLFCPNSSCYYKVYSNTTLLFENDYGMYHKQVKSFKTNSILSLEGNAMLKSVKISPNPTSDKAIITSNTYFSKVVIYNSIGVIIKSIEGLNCEKYTINTIGFEAGIYFVAISNEYGTKVVKLIVTNN